MLKQKSFVLKPAEHVKKWWVVDCKDLVVGRVATQIATLLKGKHNPKYTPNTDSGDFVVVINAEKVKFTGNKWNDKNYFTHTNHVGGLKKRTAKEQLTKHPELIIYNAVACMLPKTSLGRKQLTKLKIFVGDKHAHDAQKPEQYKVQE